MNYLHCRELESRGGLRCGCSLKNMTDSPPPFYCNLSYKVGDCKELVTAARMAFLQAAGTDPALLAEVEQVHGDRIIRVEEAGLAGQADALITNRTGVALGIYTADCLPVLIYDPVRRCIGAVHSGWKGTALNIAGKTVAALTEEYGSVPADLLVWIGPGICGSCYEVDQTVAAAFDSRFYRPRGDKYLLDLKSAVSSQLISAGVQPALIDISQACTLEGRADFHSHRRDQKLSGRHLSVIMLHSET